MFCGSAAKFVVGVGGDRMVNPLQQRQVVMGVGVEGRPLRIAAILIQPAAQSVYFPSLKTGRMQIIAGEAAGFELGF